MGKHRARAASRQIRHARGRALAVATLTALICLGLAGGAPAPRPPHLDTRIAGMQALPPPPDGPSWAPRPVTEQGLRTLATARDGSFTMHTAGGPVTFLPGVNLGSTTPGHQPGELAMTAEDYRAWFAAMHWLGIRVVRIYTIHPPAFYDQLAAHNRANPDRPLYLIQGVYPPDESYVQKQDLYDRTGTAAFTADLRDASAAVSGDLTRAPQRGRAGGTWRTDVGEWLAGWIVGLEWDPVATAASDRRNADAPAVAGRYFASAAGATPTERWLAARLEELAGVEAARGRSVPVAFVNWPTTDPLRHPDEPLPEEDLVGVDANRVLPMPAWPGGTFASYHAYPYFPDFQRHEPALQRYRYAGRGDPYAGYLDRLRRHHGDVPVMITEFGVPSSIGSAHDGPLGRSQGGHSERDAMRINADLLQLIHDVGLAGGLIFAWADEWFKLTWNTVAHQVPAERRQLWHDVLTNEQHFGLLATDATGSPDVGPQTVLEQPDGRPVRRVTARIDESYLHLRIALADPAADRVVVGLDVLPSLTGAPPPGSGDPRPDTAFEFDLRGRTGQAWIRTELDPLPLDYRLPAGTRPAPVDGWQRYQLIINRELVVPSTGRRLAPELFDAGRLRYGGWDPADPTADSRALWRLDDDNLVVRVPWALAGFADPSSHQVLVPQPAPDAELVAARATTRTVTELTVLVSADGVDQATGPVRWDGWQRVYHQERLKRGAAAVRDAMVRLAP